MLLPTFECKPTMSHPHYFYQTLEQKLQQLRLDISILVQTKPLYDCLWLQLQSQPTDAWPELLQHWQTPDLIEPKKRLEQILAALSQYEIGCYGLCADCEAEIPLTELVQDPAQQRCKKCEKEHKEN